MDNIEDYAPVVNPACNMLVRTLDNAANCRNPFNYNIERFTPPYLQAAAISGRPVINTAPASTTHGSLIAMNVGDSSTVKRVTFIRYSTTTHSTNTDQRFVELVVEAKNATTLFVRINENPNIIIPGNWFLWALNKEGIPSIAKTVNVAVGPKTEVLLPADATKNSASGLFSFSAAVGAFLVTLFSL